MKICFESGMKEYKEKQIDLWQTIVSIDQYECSAPIVYIWTFNTEKEAVDKFNFVLDNWKNPPLSKYDDFIIVNKVNVMTPPGDSNG